MESKTLEQQLISLIVNKNMSDDWTYHSGRIREIQRMANHACGVLSPEEDKHLSMVIRWLLVFNGHRGLLLRKLVQNGTSLVSNYFKQLLLELCEIQSEEDASNIIHSLLEIEVPESLVLLQTSIEKEGWYVLDQYVSFLETKHHELPYDQLFASTARALRAPDQCVKWIDLLDSIFTDIDPTPAVLQLLTQVGSIPEELMNKEKFTRKYKDAPHRVIGVIASLRHIESDKKQPLRIRQIAQFERAKVINFLLQQGIAHTLRNVQSKQANIALDTNGVFIRLIGFETHLPYGLIDDRTMDFLFQRIDQVRPCVGFRAIFCTPRKGV